MNNDQLFDEMVRMKLAQRSFGPSDAGWENMKDLLPPERKRRVIGLRTAIIACMLTALISGGFVYLLTPEKNNGSISARVTPGGIATAPRDSRPAEQLNVPAYTTDAAHEAVASSPGTAGTQQQVPPDPSATTAEHEDRALTAEVLITAEPLVPENKTITEAQPAENNRTANTQPVAPENNIAVQPLCALFRAPQSIDTVTFSRAWHPKLNHWLVQCGVSYMAPLSGASRSSFGPVIGLGYNAWLNPAWSIQTGLRYAVSTDISGVQSVNAEALATDVYSYRASQLQQLHTITLPIEVYRRIGNRHSITAGYTLSFLAAGKNNIHSYTETNGVRSNERSERTFGAAGLNRFDGLFTAGYAFRINGRFQLQAYAYTGMTDVLYNSSYGNGFERNSGAMLLLNYSF